MADILRDQTLIYNNIRSVNETFILKENYINGGQLLYLVLALIIYNTLYINVYYKYKNVSNIYILFVPSLIFVHIHSHCRCPYYNIASLFIILCILLYIHSHCRCPYITTYLVLSHHVYYYIFIVIVVHIC